MESHSSLDLCQDAAENEKLSSSLAQKKLQAWIRSRHLICLGHFFVFESVDLSAIDRFSECVTALGGSVISVDPIDKLWMGAHRRVVLYQAKASLHTPCHSLKQYWLKYGGQRSRFDGAN